MRNHKFHIGDLVESNVRGYGIVMHEGEGQMEGSIKEKEMHYVEIYHVNGIKDKQYEGTYGWDQLKVLSQGKK